MLRVGLTGGTACGKSTVIEMFRRKPHVHVIDADQLVRELYQPGQQVYAEVVSAFGREILGADSTIDRAKLADAVFSDGEKLRLLEKIVHPAVVKLQDQEMAKLGGNDIAIVEATKMLEAGSHSRYDAVLLVECPPEAQLERFRHRHPGLSAEQAAAELQRRIAAQFTDAQRRALVHPNFVIDNSGPLEDTARQVERIYNQLAARAGLK